MAMTLRAEAFGTDLMRDRAPGFERTELTAVRFNPMPVTELAALGPSPEALFEAITATRRWLDLHRDRVTDLLYLMAPSLAPVDRTRTLLPLRRDIHNGRDPKASTSRLRELGADPLVVDWVTRHGELRSAESRLQALLDAKLACERAGLRRLCDSRDFAASVAMSSRDLARDLVRYRDAPAEQLPARLLKSEPAIARYAQRAMFRTTPFSRYTAVALGEWVDGDARHALMDVELISRCEINHILVRRLLGAVVEDPAARPWVRFRLPDDWLRDGDRLRFHLTVDDPHDRPLVFRTADRTATVRENTLLSTLLTWSDSHGRPAMTPAEWTSWLAGSVPGMPSDAADRFIAGLIGAGLLQPMVDVPEQTPDVLGAAIGFLSGIATDAARSVASLLGEMRPRVAALSQPDVLDRARVLGEVAAKVDAAFQAARLAAHPKAVLVYEDAANASPARIPRAAWEGALADLEVALPVLQAFDATHLLRAFMREAFVRRFGRGGECTDIGRLSSNMDEALAAWGRAIKHRDGKAQDPDLQPIRSVQGDFLSLCRGDGTGCEVRLDRRDIANLHDRLPAKLRDTWASYCAFLQPGTTPDGNLEFVVNHIYAGMGRFISRFLPLFPERAQQELRARIASFFPERDILAEYRPVNGFNANLHPQLCGTQVDGDGPDCLRVADLCARHDLDTDEVMLVHRPSGARVHILYLGFLSPLALPRRDQAMLALEGTWLIELTNDLRRRPDHARTHPVLEWPRLRLGSVVLARRAWRVSARALPIPGAGEPDSHLWARLHEWRTGLGMPRRVYHSGERTDRGGAESQGIDELIVRAYNRRQKPTYLDFHSALSLRQFRRTLESRSGSIHFEECLPLPENAWLQSQAGRHVSEHLVEFDSNAKGGHP